MIRAYIKTATEAEWLALVAAHLTDAEGALLPAVEVDEIGVIQHTTGEVVVDGMTVPTMEPVPGWHANLTFRAEPPAAILPFCVNPVQPKRVFFGSYVLAMPELLEDDGDTVLIERSIGAEASDQQRDAAEVEYVRAKLTAEQREDRRALREAALAVVVQRAARNAAAAERDRLTLLVSAQAIVRNDFITARTTAIAGRDAIIADLNGMTGAARIPLVAARDAATAEIVRLGDEVTQASAVLAASQAARVAAADQTIAANVELLRLRAARDGAAAP